MASIILSPVVTEIISKLTNLALEQISLIYTLKSEMAKLKSTVSAIHAVLIDAEEQQFHNRQVQDWLEKLSEAMYDVDDLLDDFSTEAIRSEFAAAVGRNKVNSLKRLKYSLKMAGEIRLVREKLDDLCKDKDNFHLEVRNRIDQYQTLTPLRETDSCPPTIVVGRKEDRTKIIELLLDFNSQTLGNISVVPIVGIGGLGKTTLAQLVFDDEQTKQHFEIKVWVYVSQNFEIKEILGKMLQSMNLQSQPGDLALDVLRFLLQEKIRGKRFLFVLDDVWEENVESWEALGKYLIVGAPGSKVLVTTRSRKVAEVSCRIFMTGSSTVLPPYFLEGLSLEEACSLMLSKAFHGRVLENPNVMDVGMQILRKCCGVPLAVSTVAGLLSSKDPETEWPLFLQKELWTISEEENPIMSALRLSYNYLPPRLKRCFAFCKLFPKGHVFDVQRLVQFWRAQGYILEEGDGLDTGLRYFKTLWWRSFFQEVEMDEFGNLQSCRMHDLMHELAAAVTGKKMFKGTKSVVMECVSSSTSHRHLSVVRHGGDIVVGDGRTGELACTTSKVRTFISDDVSFLRGECWKILNSLKRLRVFVLYVRGRSGSSDASKKLLDSVGELKHLRFLCLNFDEMERLPDSITNLLNLQVLDLSWCRVLKELPKDIEKLANLMHLYLYPYGVKLTHMPKGIGKLTSLQTLPIFVVSKSCGGLDELKSLNALRGELTIRNLRNAESSSMDLVLKEKAFLQSLVLDWEYIHDDEEQEQDDPAAADTILEQLQPHQNLKKLMILNYGGTKLPNWLSTLTNLSELSLEDCRECEYLPPLHKLPCLRELVIDACPNLKGWLNLNNEHEEVLMPPCFPRLHRLEIVECPNLTHMPTFPTLEGGLELRRTSSRPFLLTMNMGTGSLCKLKHLRLVEMDDLETLPEEGFCNMTSLATLEIVKCTRLTNLVAVRSLVSLQKLEIHECPQLEDRCRKGSGEDWFNISHVQYSIRSVSPQFAKHHLEFVAENPECLSPWLESRKMVGVVAAGSAVPSVLLRNSRPWMNNCVVGTSFGDRKIGVGMDNRRRRSLLKVGPSSFFCNPTDDPILKDALKEPVAFLGGMFAGLLRLDLNEEPLKEWVTRTVEASGIKEEIDAEAGKEAADGTDESPLQIQIE
ncbi:Putative disease resistance protein RGA4 [Linum grandiflorum]